MASKVYLIAVSSCLMLGGTACHREMAVTFPGPGVALDTCESQPTSPTYSTVIRVMIPSSMLDLQKLSKNPKFVKYNNQKTDPKKKNEKKEYDNSKTNTSSLPAYDLNPLHIDLSTIEYPKLPDTSSHVMVRIFFENTDMQFWEDGVQRPAAEFQEYLCRPEDEDPNDPGNVYGSTFTFYVKRKAQDSNAPKELSINVLLVAKPGKIGDDTPIIIDPKIKNDG